MNYLAHLVLSGPDPEVRMGNLMGDFCVGRLEHPRFQKYSAHVRLGLALHRWIDEKTDQEISFGPVWDYLRPYYGKWSPAILDILGDYCVVVAWEQWGLGEFKAFEDQIYTDLSDQFDLAPENMKPMLVSLLKHRWFGGYGTWEGMERAIGSVSQRINQPFSLEPIRHLVVVEPDRLLSVHIPFFLHMIQRSDAFRSSQLARFL